jgi:succinate dehydrogenase / fumarate reductase cytochrome b subunit
MLHHDTNAANETGTVFLMAEPTPGSAGRPIARPMSPHLSIFRPYVNMVMSILHRMTGSANYVGSVFLAAWLLSASAGEEQYNGIMSFFGSVPGLVILFGFTWSVMHHMLGGVRHMIWDAGRGFELPTVRMLSWGTLFGSLVLTAVIWIAALSRAGV